MNSRIGRGEVRDMIARLNRYAVGRAAEDSRPPVDWLDKWAAHRASKGYAIPEDRADLQHEAQRAWDGPILTSLGMALDLPCPEGGPLGRLAPEILEWARTILGRLQESEEALAQARDRASRWEQQHGTALTERDAARGECLDLMAALAATRAELAKARADLAEERLAHAATREEGERSAREAAREVDGARSREAAWRTSAEAALAVVDVLRAAVRLPGGSAVRGVIE